MARLPVRAQGLKRSPLQLFHCAFGFAQLLRHFVQASLFHITQFDPDVREPVHQLEQHGSAIELLIRLGYLGRRLSQALEHVTELHLNIDGVEVEHISEHRVLSSVFSLYFATADTLETYNAGHPVLGWDDPVLADGYWVMIEPLPPGPHELRFGASVGPPFNFSVTITDHITVTPTVAPTPEVTSH